MGMVRLMKDAIWFWIAIILIAVGGLLQVIGKIGQILTR